MKKKTIAVVLTIALVVVFSWGQQALAAWMLYDDFNGSSIDATKWDISTRGDFSLSVGGGNLLLSGNGSGSGISSIPAGYLYATLDLDTVNGAALAYSGYSSTNTGSDGAGVFLTVGYFRFTGDPISDFLVIERLTNANGNYLWAGHIVETTITTINIIPYSGDSGSLGIVSSSAALSFIYGDSNYSNWATLASISFGGIQDTPTLMIGGTAGNNGFTTVEIGSVVVNPVPLPAGVWLLGSGLVGLAGFRRKFRNI